jgi:hypothetical protein
VQIGEAIVMWTFYARVAAIAGGIGLVLACNQPPALARGSQVGHDDPWNAERIQRLPPEVRNAVAHMCADAPRAGQYFATYLDNARLMKLHFEDLQCNGQARFCKGASCLRQEYMSSGGQYHLMKSYYQRSD